MWADFANDGWLDLYVANDMKPNYLFKNKHDGTFEDIGLLPERRSMATGRCKDRWASMLRISITRAARHYW